PEVEGEEGQRPVLKLVLRPREVISVTRGSSFVTLYPEDTFRFTSGVDRHKEAPVIGKQWFSWCMWEDMHYRYSLGDARPFLSSPQQAIGMREAGWLQAGVDGVVMVAHGERWYDTDLVRHEDEPARRQMQDLIGHLALLARSGHSGLPAGHIVCYDADPELFAAFLARVLESCGPEDWVPLRDIMGPSRPVDYEALMDSVLGSPDEFEEDEGTEGEEGEEGEGAAAAYGGGEGEEEDEEYEGAQEGDGEDEVEEGEYE
ncbi:hypothetical protein Agub_g7769, partial [Astrephomene gubernaculifera]